MTSSLALRYHGLYLGKFYQIWWGMTSTTSFEPVSTPGVKHIYKEGWL